MGTMLNAEVAASVPAPGPPPSRTLPAELSPPPAASDACVPTKAPPGTPSSVKTVFVIKVTGAEPIPKDSEECAPPVEEEGESETRGLPKERETLGFRRAACAEEWNSVPGETSEELSDSEYGHPAPDEMPYNPYALEFEGRFGCIVEDPPRAGTSAAASAQPQEGIEQNECAAAASEKDASEDSDGE